MKWNRTDDQRTKEPHKLPTELTRIEIFRKQMYYKFRLHEMIWTTYRISVESKFSLSSVKKDAILDTSDLVYKFSF